MVLRFRLAGLPVQVHPLFLLAALALGARWPVEPVRLAVWFGAVFLSVLLHELGHALAFRRLGLPAEIALHGLGGTTTARGEERLSHRQALGVALEGPVVSFAIGGGVLALQRFSPLGQAGGLTQLIIEALLWVNLGWGALNLLPIRPLDGGNMLAALLHMRGADRHERLLHRMGWGAVAVVVVLVIVWENVWLGLFAIALGFMNLESMLRARQTETHRRQLRQIHSARRSALPRDAVAVERLLSELRAPARPSPPAPRAPPPSPAPEPPDVPHDPRLVGELLLGSGLAQLAIRPLQAAFTAEPSAQTGHALATALLEAGRYPEVARLLEDPTATHLGEETLVLIATRADTSGQTALATRARELRQRADRPTPEALPAPGADASKKPG